MLKLLISPLLVAILVFAATGYAAVTTEAEYLFGDDGVGTNNVPLDSSGNGRDIANSAGGATVSSTGGPAGDAYYSFDGATGGFFGYDYDPPEDNVGVEAWVRTSNLTQVNRHVFGTGHNNNGLALIYDSRSDRGWAGAVGGVAWVGTLGVGNYTAGEWIHLALVRDNGTTTFYVNGAVVGAGSAATPNLADSDIHIGVSSGGETKYDGDIAYGRIFTFNPGEFEAADLNLTFTTARAPDPSHSATGIEIDLSARSIPGTLSWTAPDAYVGATYDVYFGTSEPDELLADYGLTKLTVTPQSETSIAPTAFLPLDYDMEYHWVVDAYEPNDLPGGVDLLYPGSAWSFTTTTTVATPVISAVLPDYTVVAPGADTDLSVTATDADTLQWKKDGSPISDGVDYSGVTTETLTILGAAVTDEGVYTCTATNAAGTATSDPGGTVYLEQLVMAYEFEGNVDDTVGTNNGTAHNGPTYATGVSGQAINFSSASNAYVLVPNSSDVNLRSTGTYTVSAWVNLTSTDHQMILFHGLGCSTWASWYMSVGGSENREASGNFVFGVRSGNGPSTTQVKGPAVSGSWVHVLATYDGIVLKLFLDGIEADSLTTSVLPYDSNENLHMGGDPGCGGRFFLNGQVDEISIYNHALNELEVLDLYFQYGDIKAYSPQPKNNATGVSALSTVLNWAGYPGTESYKVCFGKTNPPPLVVDSQSPTSYTPPLPLDYDTTYYWKIDSIKSGQTYPGDVWTFKTLPRPLDPDVLGFDEIIFIKRRPYTSDHYYTVINNGTSSGLFQAENGIYIYNVRTQQERPVITAADFPAGTSGTGVIGKFTLSFDATKVVFDYRDHQSDGFRIWEVNVDGTGLRQISFPPPDEAEKLARWGGSNFHTDDVDPAYLPDGDIIFSSNRCEYAILCGGSAHLSAAVMHRMDPDDPLSVEQLSQSPVSEFCPTILDDGRVMYHRWEYIDKGHRAPKCIYSMNPDGSKSQELFGLSESYYNTGAHMYPMPVPGSDNKIVVVTAPHYPQGNSVGSIQIIDLSKDNRTLEGLTNITPGVEMHSDQAGWYFAFDNFAAQHQDGIGGPLYGTPWPTSPSEFLVVYKQDWNAHYRDVPGAYAIYLINTSGEHHYIYRDPDVTVSCWHPVPLVARKRPPKIHSFRSPALEQANEALCIVTNVYEGMDGVQPDEVKWLRINEAVPRYWDTHRRWSPSVSSNSWKAALWTRVQWGVVPVEADGSAYFKVPADRNIFMQALDENFAEIQRERTYVNYRPGEIRSCVGCHEKAGHAPRPIGTEAPMALKRSPSVLQAQPCDLTENGGDGRPEQVIHYPADIQPIFDAKCISCHGGSNPAGTLNLTDPLTSYYSTSYEQLLSKELAGYAVPEFSSITSGKGGGNDLGSFLPPKSMGCYDSVMMQMLTDPGDQAHYGILDDNQLMLLRRWVDSNYQFYGGYYGRHIWDHQSDPDFRRRPTFEEAVSPTAPAWHD